MVCGVKKCFKCEKTKPLEEFYKHPMMADGHLNKCITCTKKDVRENREAKREYYIEFDKKRANLPHRVEKRKQYSMTQRGKESIFKATKKFRRNNPEKYAAHGAVSIAVSTGKIAKPSVCAECGRFAKVQGHHEDYAKPLEVVWLCSTCHSKRHRGGDMKRSAAV